MRAASAALISLLNSGVEFAIADLLTIALADGTIIRLTNAGPSITVTSKYDNASHTFLGGGPTFTRNQTKLVVGLEVDSMPITIFTDPTSQLLEGLPWPQQARAGLFDEARILLERLFMASWTDVSAGTMIEFWGRVGQVVPSRNAVQLTVNSDLELLTMAMPRNTYQPQCLHALYDTGCTLSKAAFTVTNAAIAGSTASVINSTLGQADKYFELGVITFTSGANNGLAHTVKKFLNASGAITVSVAFPNIPANGDTFSIYPGCDKVVAIGGDITAGTCATKFSNVINAKALPFIPTPENAR